MSPTHPLLVLKRALPWDAITEAMMRHWRAHGKNVDGGPGLPWDVSLYVPLVVLMLIKHFDSRQMEAYLERVAQVAQSPRNILVRHRTRRNIVASSLVTRKDEQMMNFCGALSTIQSENQ